MLLHAWDERRLLAARGASIADSDAEHIALLVFVKLAVLDSVVVANEDGLVDGQSKGEDVVADLCRVVLELASRRPEDEDLLALRRWRYAFPTVVFVAR